MRAPQEDTSKMLQSNKINAFKKIYTTKKGNSPLLIHGFYAKNRRFKAVIDAIRLKKCPM